MKTFVHAVAALFVLFADWLTGASRDADEPARAPIVRFIVKHPWMTLFALATGALITAALVVVSGVVPIKASSGHWPITARLLDFAKVRSVATHSLGIEAPPLETEGIVLRGATHYELGCSSCHGRPGVGVSPVMAAMTPAPPQLPQGLSRYSPQQLFTIVKHGIKFTGMPAWPAQRRDDEVWAMVAFLRAMPRLDAESYRQLAHGEVSGDVVATANVATVPDPERPAVVRDTCARCHGVDGTGRGPAAFPSLAGQRADYLYGSLRAFANRSRFSGIMGGIAANLTDDTMRQLAAYYESLPLRSGGAVSDERAVAAGATIASQGVPDLDIPACAECHGPTATPKNPAYPRLAGQPANYLASQLELLKQRRRGGSANVTLMEAFVDRLRPDHIRDVTLYYGSLRQ